MNLSERFPPLYSCSVCGKGVKVIPQGVGVEPIYEYHKECSHRNVAIHANRKVTLVGKGSMNIAEQASYKITLTVRQLLSALFGRSI